MRWFYFLLIFLVPFILIIYNCGAIIVTLCRHCRRVETTNGNLLNDQEMKERKNALMVVIVAITFLLLNSMAFAVNAIETLGKNECALNDISDTISIGSTNTSLHYHYNDHVTKYDPEVNELEEDSAPNKCFLLTFLFWISIDVSTVLVHINNCVNFFIYLIFNLQFRSVCFKIVVTCVKCFPDTTDADDDEDCEDDELQTFLETRCNETNYQSTALKEV